MRAFFGWQELRKLEIFEDIQNKKSSLINTANLSPGDLNAKYRETLAKEIGLKKFDDYIFLQLYIFTFDESRRVIFWDERGSQIALSMAFFSDQDNAKKLIEVKRSMEKHESIGRNKKWQATQTQKKIKEIQNISRPEDEELRREYRGIFSNHEDAVKIHDQIKIEYDSMNRRQSTLHSSIWQLRKNHKALFNKYQEPRSVLLGNTYIRMSLQKKECILCGARGDYIKTSIENNIHRKDECPLCSTGIVDEKRSKEQDNILSEIENIDKQISQKVKDLENITIEMEEKYKELEKAKFELEEIEKQKNAFERKYNHLPLLIRTNPAIESLITQYQSNINDLLSESKEEYQKRDELKPIYNNLQSILKEEYRKAETYFVPVFRELAMSFIGLGLDVLVERKSNMLTLSLTLQDIVRTDFHQLSESQRFFLDIALRMSLAIYMSRKRQEATMYIDTPEGSLDIAYESRAGHMFAEFVKRNHHIIMTANINASQLLIALAKECGKARMHLRRMLEWTDLSEVQKSGEFLFEKAYENIERALKEKKNAQSPDLT